MTAPMISGAATAANAPATANSGAVATNAPRPPRPRLVNSGPIVNGVSSAAAPRPPTNPPSPPSTEPVRDCPPRPAPSDAPRNGNSGAAAAPNPARLNAPD